MKKYTTKSLHPDSPGLNHEAYKRGYALFQGRDFQKAKLAFEEALSYWPKDSQAWMALGNCEDELGRPKIAERSFRRALMYCNDKNRNDIRFNLANSLLDQERYDEAIAIYEQIPAESDSYGAAQRNLLIARQQARVGKA